MAVVSWLFAKLKIKGNLNNNMSTNNTQPKTYVIAVKELPISLLELESCLASAKKHNWDIEVFWGTYGKTLSLESWNSIGVKPLIYKGSMTQNGTWGCFFSHFRLWNRCVELDEPLIILEHDASIQASWKDINFSTSLLKLHKDGTIDAVDWYDPDSGRGTARTHAYYITPENAKKLISFSKEVGGFATDRMMGDKVVDLKHTDVDIVTSLHTHCTTIQL